MVRAQCSGGAPDELYNYRSRTVLKVQRVIRQQLSSRINQMLQSHPTVVRASLSRSRTAGGIPSKHRSINFKALKGTSTDAAAWFKSRLVDLAHQYQRTHISQQCLQNKEHINQLKEIRKNTELIILPQDKGSGVVLLNRADYINKMYSILSGTSKFVIDEDQTDAVQNAERQINRALKNLHHKGLIEQTNLKKLSPKGSVTPIM
ncbi:uncharacterized protein DEA37_0010760 [Paragonimus westermani]|uniref:Uncharacterized protein n=1 Tax=Paragonimus westermani TaxID=34504 RepID=A0A5J4P0K2_9TREM|nr:uncharacterized protein DEA37_0010760 [Paragonimus westermani]